MEKVNKKPITILQCYKMVKNALLGNDEEVITDLDEIDSWEESVNKIDTFSESDKKIIQNIQNTEAELKQLYKIKLDSYKKKLENQVNSSKGRKKGTNYKIKQEENEIGE